MQIQIQFEYGPLHVEVESEDGEDYDKVLDDIASFIDENEPLFGTVDFEQTPENGQGDEENSSDSNQEETNLSQFTDGEPNEDSGGNSGWGKLVRETGVSEEKLRYMFGVGEDVHPQILFGDKLTEESNTEQMLRGTLLILSVWEDYYGNDSLVKEEITDSLRKSGIHHNDYYNVYQRSEFSTYFIRDEVSRDKTGGETSEISLTPPGKSKAYELIEKYSEQIDA